MHIYFIFSSLKPAVKTRALEKKYWDKWNLHLAFHLLLGTLYFYLNKKGKSYNYWGVMKYDIFICFIYDRIKGPETLSDFHLVLFFYLSFALTQSSAKWVREKGEKNRLWKQWKSNHGSTHIKISHPNTGQSGESKKV